MIYNNLTNNIFHTKARQSQSRKRHNSLDIWR